MSIDQENVIDFHYVDPKTGRGVLAISDHLPYDHDQAEHILLL